MSLAPGTKLGPYEIVSPLGAGGMGEVYRARDTRLGRDVAIKVLPANLSSDAQRRERFEREARAISALNHPHICTLYDVGREADTDFLVMELVEGESLATRIAKGPLPTEQVLRFGSEIADALDKAHRLGITHRDLKPGNIMLTKSGIKLLDFGLAKIAGPASAAASAETMLSTKLPAASKPLTAEGSIVGTYQYMAPEQLEGAEADARSDIFAFGAVLYEMATGRRAFDGKTTASVIAAVLAAEPPPISSLQPMTPPALERLIKICLAKDPDERFQSAHDLSLQLKWISEGGSQAGVAAPVVAHRRGRERVAWALAAVGLLAAAALAVVFGRSYLNQPKPSVMRFVISPPDDISFLSQITVTGLASSVGVASPSPDGRFVAFVGVSKDGSRQLWLRPLDNLNAQPLPGTQGAYYPFWSPDSRYVGFFDAANLKKVAISGGSAQSLCSASSSGGGTWNADGLIVFSAGSGPLMKVSEAGGDPSPLGTLDQSAGEIAKEFPSFLPDDRHFLYASVRAAFIHGLRICVGSLDSNESNCFLDADSLAVYAPPGYLLYLRAGTLMAQPFDAGRVATTGDPVPIAENVQSFSASQSGILTYSSRGASNQNELQWFDRTGKKLGTVGQPAVYSSPELSPDGTRAVVAITDPQLGTRDLWIFDLKRTAASRFTFDPTDEISPRWSHDAGQILYTSTQTGTRDIYEKAATGIGDSQQVFASKDQQKSVDDWSSDGRYVVYDTTGSPAHLWILPLFGDRKPVPLVQDNYDTRQARFSPDGRYIAYASKESGQFEIYVQTFPQASGKWQVSSGGGTHPEWRHDGKELFFLSGTSLMAADVNTAGPQFSASIPKQLFDSDFQLGFANSIYAPTADGQRFLAVTTMSQQQAPPPITVVTSWASDLKP
jgi:eukaryotic-like serine/threonine-protein kinase